MDSLIKNSSLAPNPNKSWSGEAGAASGPSNRKRRMANTFENSCSIFENHKETSLGWSPYLVVSPKNKENDLTTLSIFAISKALSTIGITKPKGVTRTRSGELMIETKNSAESMQLLNCKQFGTIPVTVSPHNSLNSSKGVVKSFELKHATDEEMKENIKGVTDARRIVIQRDGKTIATNTIVLTFDTPKPPTKIDVEYLQIEVRPYIPNPMRCFKCHRFGHTKNNCRGKELCPNCGQEGHTENCSAESWCRNCRKGGHKSISKECPKWKEEKAILEHKATYGGTFAQARAALFPRKSAENNTLTKSFAVAVTQGPTVPDPKVKGSKPPFKPTPKVKPAKNSSQPTFNLKLDIPTFNKFEGLSTEEGEAVPPAPPTSSPPTSTPTPSLAPLMSIPVNPTPGTSFDPSVVPLDDSWDEDMDSSSTLINSQENPPPQGLTGKERSQPSTPINHEHSVSDKGNPLKTQKKPQKLTQSKETDKSVRSVVFKKSDKEQSKHKNKK